MRDGQRGQGLAAGPGGPHLQRSKAQRHTIAGGRESMPARDGGGPPPLSKPSMGQTISREAQRTQARVPVGCVQVPAAACCSQAVFVQSGHMRPVMHHCGDLTLDLLPCQQHRGQFGDLYTWAIPCQTLSAWASPLTMSGGSVMQNAV